MIKDKAFFGETKTGQTAYKYFLHNSKGMRVVLSDFGALVLSIEIPDANGLLRDVALGFEKIEDYYCIETGMGAYIGRNANRIKDAKVRINGEEYILDQNDGNNNLHSGFNRSHCKIYKAKQGCSQDEMYVEFYRISPDMEQGMPGNLQQKIRYTLTEKNEFIIDYEMVCDKTTIVNPTNHTYFNLDGHNEGDILNQKMEIYSDKFLETDSNLIPTGIILDVANTPMDFCCKKKIGKDIYSDFLQLKYANGYDHNYCFENDKKMKKMAKIYASESGINMTVFSDLCGLQVYSGNFLNSERGKYGCIYKKNTGICFETQFYPNSCNDRRFASPILAAGKNFKSRTIYQFDVE